MTGTPSIFVRASGCNLRCGFCDTPYASWTSEGQNLAVDEILARVEDLARSRAGDSPIFVSPPTISRGCPVETRKPGQSPPVRHVVVTGGEPMLFADLAPLCETLADRGYHVTVETAGTVYLPVRCALMSISPKLSNSTPRSEAASDWSCRHDRARRAPEVIHRLNAEYDCQFKFVVGSLADCAEVESYLAALPEIDRGRVMLMPLGTEAEELARTGRWLEPYCAEHGLAFCPRRHIEWFGTRRGT